MTMTDPIADLLTRIRNATMAGHSSLELSASVIKESIVKILESEGYIKGWSKVESKPFNILKIELKYDDNGKSAIQGLQRASKPGRRVYVGSDEIPQVRSGLGISIVSTSKGVLAGYLATKQNVGGELLCTVW